MTAPDRLRPSWRARLLALPIGFALLLPGLTACGGPQRLSGGCGIVVDGSGSSRETTGFNADQQLRKDLDRFLLKAKCRNVVFAAITVNSAASTCSSEPIDLDPDEIGTTPREQVRASFRAATLIAAQSLLKCIYDDKRNDGGSDVLGGLARIARSHPDSAGDFNVLVVSDFMHTDPHVSLYRADLGTELKREKIIDGLVDRGQISDLSSIKLTTSGYGMLQGKDPAKFSQFDAFWRSVLKDHAGVPEPLTLQ
ncbi:hypothetical protein ABGB12_34265 [Actinocorallia sp. B10E7]|uniref:hypothetical protein n=1 Tax=Actinocorallia sp. B10E7 TaxID=3153558 RepID=UPI00325CFABB